MKVPEQNPLDIVADEDEDENELEYQDEVDDLNLEKDKNSVSDSILKIRTTFKKLRNSGELTETFKSCCIIAKKI